MKPDLRKPENSDNNGDRLLSSVPPQMDSLDIQIIDELLTDANITSTAIASKYKVPLSTVQRRRAALESSSMVRHEYGLNADTFGLRRAELWVMVEKGKTGTVAQLVFEKYNNVTSICQQMNSISNLGLTAYLTTSEQLYNMLEDIKAMTFVRDVEYAEVVKVTHTRPINFLKTQPKE